MAEDVPFDPCPFNSSAYAVAGKAEIGRRVIEGISLNPELMKMLFFLKLVLCCQDFRNPRGGKHFPGAGSGGQPFEVSRIWRGYEGP
jgi:hypothetical protein